MKDFIYSPSCLCNTESHPGGALVRGVASPTRLESSPARYKLLARSSYSSPKRCNSAALGPAVWGGFLFAFVRANRTLASIRDRRDRGRRSECDSVIPSARPLLASCKRDWQIIAFECSKRRGCGQLAIKRGRRREGGGGARTGFSCLLILGGGVSGRLPVRRKRRRKGRTRAPLEGKWASE